MADPITTAFAGAARTLAPAVPAALAEPTLFGEGALLAVGTALVATELANQARQGNLKVPDLGGMLDGLLKTVQFGSGEVLPGPDEGEQIIDPGIIQDPLPQGSKEDVALVNLESRVDEMITTVFPGAGADEFLNTAIETFPLDSIPDELKSGVLKTEAAEGEEVFPVVDKFGEEITKFNYIISEDRTQAVDQMHFLTAGEDVEPSDLLRGFINKEQKAFGSRIKDPGRDVFVTTAEELGKTTFESLDAEFKMAKKFLIHNPEFKFFVPSLTNKDVTVGGIEQLDLKNIPKDRIFSAERILGKSGKTEKTPCATCFKDTAKAVTNGAEGLPDLAKVDNPKVIHGEATLNTAKGKSRGSHSWIEFSSGGSDFIWDPQLKETFPKKDYLKSVNAKAINSFDPEEVITLGVKVGNFGPFTKEEIGK